MYFLVFKTSIPPNLCVSKFITQMKEGEFRSEMAAYEETNFEEDVKIRSVPVMDFVSCIPVLRDMRDAARRKEEKGKREEKNKRKRQKECQELQQSVSSPAKTPRTLKLFSPVRAFPLGGTGENGDVGDGVNRSISDENRDFAAEMEKANTIDAMREDHPYAFGFADVKGKEHSYRFATDSFKETYDECFPYVVDLGDAATVGVVGRPHTNPQKIRAGDDVQVVVYGRKPSRHPFSLTYAQAQQQSRAIPDLTRQYSTDIMTSAYAENLWLTVKSVTTTGLIHATAKHSCKTFPLDRKTGLLAFPSTCIVGMKRGKNWPKAAA